MARKSKNKGKKPYLFEEILEIFKKSPSKTFNYKQIGAAAGIKDVGQRQLLPNILAELSDKELIIEVGNGKFKAIAGKERIVTGTVDLTQSGAGYVVSDELEQDVYLNPKAAAGLLHGDLVKVKIFASAGNDKPKGQVVEIVKRARTEFVGTIQLSQRFAFLVPSSAKQGVDIYIPLDKLNGAKNGQKAVVKITEWPAKAINPIGEVVDVLGDAGENTTEMHAILAEYGLPYHFPKEVERIASFLPTVITEEEIAKRRDFRKITTFTIDPVDAKDFDDALSIQQLANGNWEVGIHIADVSHYVKKNTVIDKEAGIRATSVYLVDRVVPMLPEVLSNNVCSLRPNEDKLCFSAVFEMNEEAAIVGEWFGKTIICSARRYTYEDAQALLEDAFEKEADGNAVPGGKDADFQLELLTLDKLAKKLRAERMRKGSIAFEKSEVKFHLDESGNPTGVYFKVMKDSNQLIEDFMLLANRRVAAFAGDRGMKKEPLPFVYRVHGKPDDSRLGELNQFVAKFGYKINLAGDKQTVESLNKLLKDVEGKSEANVISLLTIRTMMKAVYTTKNIGHYGLGFDFYTHFTSPIRRYPDVLVHRLLEHYLAGGKPEDAEALEAECKHSSEMEKLAADAERSSIKYKQVQFLQNRIGEEFDGMISGVTEWGIFIELNENHCEGMIRIRDLKDDFYTFDEENYCLVGRRFKRKLRLGDQLRIEIKGANLVKKQLDFVLVDYIDFDESTKKDKNGPVEPDALHGRKRPSKLKNADKTKPRDKQTERAVERQGGNKPDGGKADDKLDNRKTKNNNTKVSSSSFYDEWGFEV